MDYYIFPTSCFETLPYNPEIDIRDLDQESQNKILQEHRLFPNLTLALCQLFEIDMDQLMQQLIQQLQTQNTVFTMLGAAIQAQTNAGPPQANVTVSQDSANIF
jgi:hypothetical protein